jgi:hypothetical protein
MLAFSRHNASKGVSGSRQAQAEEIIISSGQGM